MDFYTKRHLHKNLQTKRQFRHNISRRAKEELRKAQNKSHDFEAGLKTKAQKIRVL